MTPIQPDNTYNGSLITQAASLPKAWQPALITPEVQAALHQLDRFLAQRLQQKAAIFPSTPFKALQLIEPDDVRVIILGQDPYHGVGQAQGLAFSVPDSCPCPPSLRNIFHELTREFPDVLRHQSHNLEPWVDQGVLLLNAVLTVEAGKPASHANHGWETVTDALIRHVALLEQPKVFMLWGNYARQKQALIPKNDQTLVLCANHPSPLSARRPPVPFIGCDHFVQANQWLELRGQSPIQWL